MNWESPTCEICGTKKFLCPYHSGVFYYEYPGEFNFVQCRKCKLVFQSPRILASQVSRYYPPQTYWGRGQMLSNNRYERMYKAIFTARPTPGRILDVGTGIGLFLTRFRHLGWQVEGTEISQDSAKFAKRHYQIPVHIGQLEDLNLRPHSYDVVVLNHVLEHLYHPKSVLTVCHRLLKKDGLLVVAVPNIAGIGHFIFQKNWYALQPGRHIYHFSPTTLGKILELAGFQITKKLPSDFIHDKYAFFQSLRYLRSRPQPVSRTNSGAPAISRLSILKQALTFLASTLSYIVAFIEKITNKGDVIVFLAQKNSHAN